jgi:hypothetical protein
MVKTLDGPLAGMNIVGLHTAEYHLIDERGEIFAAYYAEDPRGVEYRRIASGRTLGDAWAELTPVYRTLPVYSYEDLVTRTLRLQLDGEYRERVEPPARLSCLEVGLVCIVVHRRFVDLARITAIRPTKFGDVVEVEIPKNARECSHDIRMYYRMDLGDGRYQVRPELAREAQWSPPGTAEEWLRSTSYPERTVTVPSAVSERCKRTNVDEGWSWMATSYDGNQATLSFQWKGE